MDKEEIKKSKIYKAASIALSNGFMRAYDVTTMGHYMFVQGYKFAKTDELPISDLDNIGKEEKETENNV